MSENKYRDYLTDDKTFYRQYLKNEDEPVGSSSFTKIITGAAAAVGLAAGAAAAYRRGAFRNQLEYLIDKLGDYRTTRIGSTLESVRNWTKDDYWNDIQQMNSWMHRMIGRMQMVRELPNYLAQGHAFHDARMAELRRNPVIQDRPFELHAYINQFKQTLRRYEQGAMDIKRQMELDLMRNEARKLMDDAMKGLLVFDREKQEALLKRTGYRQATVLDIWDYLPANVRRDLEQFEKQLAEPARQAGYSIMNKIIDPNILVKVDEKGKITKIADLRDFRHALASSMDTLAEDFTIPFIKINPIRMFYLNEFTKNNVPRVFADLSKSKVQPYVNQNGIPFIGDSVFVNGRVYTFKYQYDENGIPVKGEFVPLKNPGYLVSARNEGRGSLLARSTKNMMNLYKDTMVFTQPQGFFKRRIWRPIAEFFDIGFQSERIGHDPEMGDPASYFSWLARKLHNGFAGWSGWKPYGELIIHGTPFGEGAEWLFIPRYKTLKEINESGGGVKDYFAQFFAGRNNPEDVTTASFIFYTFAERLNATLNQVGLGLNAKHLGSAPQILWNLTMRRVAPVVVGVEAIKYSNYLYENIFGDEYEDQLANLFVDAQIGLARLRDTLGITDWAKEMTQILPGFEFISELPVPVLTTEGLTPIMLRDFFPLDKTEEELKEYYESGEEPVRKGRYWEFGNTPYTGGKIDYFQPNWYRRITSDWQYTETLWGSKEEYWDNHWLISPLNHFFLDPYHWEKKHYEDRPYPITGGIPEIENFPLIGPILNATIGQILKPEIIMHQEEMQNPGIYRERLGFQIAEALGIIESNTGSPLHSGGIVGVHSGLAGAQSAAQVYSGVTEDKFSGGLTVGEPLAYVTASGQVQIMASTGTASVSQINRMLDESGIAKTGTAEEVELAATPVYENPEEYVNPGMMQLALSDFHYNVTEMAGFYGWVSTLFTNMKESQYEPQLMSSSKAFGYERAFWDKDYGNIGADAMEIFRRFIPRDEHKNYINPLDNRMPTWLPGPEYFVDFQHGDPYVKVKKGEMRLPGEAYERLYGIDSERLMDLEIGASFIGYDVKTIIDHWLHRDDAKANEDDLKGGTRLHKKLEKEFKEEGVAVKTEQRVEDKEHKIYGFYDMYADQRKLLEWAFKEGIEIQYYRAGMGGGKGKYEGYYSSPETVTPEIAAQIVAQSPYATVDIKTRSDKQFQKGELHFENAQQVNFYAHHMGTAVNAIIEYNRDDPEAKPKLYLFDYNPYLYEYSVNKVEVARAAVRQMLDDGAIGRGDLYGPVDRYRILADVAPYSEEFRKLKAQLSKMDLSEAEREEIRRINKQLAARKEAVRTYDYRFKTANVKDMTVTVKKVIDNNMFLTEEFGEHPIRLAGVYVPTGKDEKGEAARKFIRQYIREGVRLTIAVDADEQNRINDDTYQTISAVVRVGNIRNLNRELIERGLAKEKENDYSPTGVHARFSPAEIAFGKAWETFAHLDTPFHTKLLQVRSPLEQYERREVYGKDWQTWDEPIDDYLIPWYQNWISKSPVAAIALGAFIGSLFGGGRNTRFGRIMGALIGGTASLLGVTYVQAIEGLTGERWIPNRRLQEREVEEYFDMLKYVKFRALYEEAADMALEKEGFDVRAYLAKQKMEGDIRKKRLQELREIKRDLLAEKHDAIQRAKEIVGRRPNIDAYMKAINQEIEKLQNARKAERITPIAAQAIQYYNESERTMYAYDPGDPIENLLAALPRKERIYLTKFLKAPEEERGRILETVPSYVRRVLQAAWGMKVDEKPDIVEYFTHHQLPGPDWVGWDPRANLDDIKLKLVKREGLDLSEFNFWPEDEKRAERIKDSVVPNIDMETTAAVVRKKLREVLGEAGFRNLQVDVVKTKEPGIHMDIDVLVDRRQEIIQQLNENGYSLI